MFSQGPRCFRPPSPLSLSLCPSSPPSPFLAFSFSTYFSPLLRGLTVVFCEFFDTLWRCIYQGFLLVDFSCQRNSCRCQWDYKYNSYSSCVNRLEQIFVFSPLYSWVIFWDISSYLEIVENPFLSLSLSLLYIRWFLSFLPLPSLCL